MSRDLRSDETFDRLMNAWLDERAHAGDADAVLDAALARTSRTRPLPAWRLPERWIPVQLTTRLQPLPRSGADPAPRWSPVGRCRGDRRCRLAATPASALRSGGAGLVAFVADGHLWTANPDGSGRVQLTSDPRIDGFPTFSRDGTKIAFKRLPVPNSTPNWQEWGDVMVADADGGHPIVLDANVHSPSPISWSPDGRFIVYSRTVGR